MKEKVKKKGNTPKPRSISGKSQSGSNSESGEEKPKTF
jgi:hypothetical protein